MFRAALRLLTRNWNIIVPGLLVGFVLGVVSWLLAPPPEASFVQEQISNALIAVAQIVGSILAIAYTTGMAHAAWERGAATFADGRRAFERDGGHVLMAMLGLFALGVVAMLLANYTWWFSVAAYAYMAIYTMPAAVAGERPGLQAIVESGEIAVRRVVPTLVVVAGLALSAFAAALVALLLDESIPVIGHVFAAVLVQITIAYVTLVVVGEYLALRELAAVEAAQR